MLGMKNEQINRLNFRDDDEFIVFIRDHLRETYPDLLDPFPDEDFCEVAARGIERARRYGMLEYGDLAAFLALMFEIAPNFDSEPRIAAILTQIDQPAENRWERLFDDSMADAWDAAEDAYDERAWFDD